MKLETDEKVINYIRRKIAEAGKTQNRGDETSQK